VSEDYHFGILELIEDWRCQVGGAHPAPCGCWYCSKAQDMREWAKKALGKEKSVVE